MVFEVKNPDYDLSPYTGMTRQHWLEAGRYLLEGIFGNIGGMEDPLVMPRKETRITYPHLDASQEQQEAERRAEIFEGLTRSFFIASVLIRNEPDIEICGIRLKDYYRKHILRACTRGDAVYVGNYEEMQELTGRTTPERRRTALRRFYPALPMEIRCPRTGGFSICWIWPFFIRKGMRLTGRS